MRLGRLRAVQGISLIFSSVLALTALADSTVVAARGGEIRPASLLLEVAGGGCFVAVAVLIARGRFSPLLWQMGVTGTGVVIVARVGGPVSTLLGWETTTNVGAAAGVLMSWVIYLLAASTLFDVRYEKGVLHINERYMYDAWPWRIYLATLVLAIVLTNWPSLWDRGSGPWVIQFGRWYGALSVGGAWLVQVAWGGNAAIRRIGSQAVYFSLLGMVFLVCMDALRLEARGSLWVAGLRLAVIVAALVLQGGDLERQRLARA